MSEAVRGRFASIPEIDCTPLYDGDAGARRRLAQDLGRMLEVVGFAYIVGHRVPFDLVEAMREEAKAFFALPDAEKRAIAINRFHRGYMEPNSSTIVTSTVAKVTKPNRSESFLAMHELPENDPDRLAGKPLQGPNQWPESLPSFRGMALLYMTAMEDLARRLVRAVALALELDEDHFAADFARPTVFLRLLHYPPQEPEEGLFGAAPHTDYGFLTLLAQDDLGGLEVLNKEKAWIPAPPADGSFVMNVGDILERWSNGRFASTPHRVRNLSPRHRYSQPYFFDPSMDTVVSPIGTPQPGWKPVPQEPVRYGDYLMNRLNRNYSYRSTEG